MASEPGQDPRIRKANIRLAVALGLLALGFYLIMVVFKPLMGF